MASTSSMALLGLANKTMATRPQTTQYSMVAKPFAANDFFCCKKLQGNSVLYISDQVCINDG